MLQIDSVFNTLVIVIVEYCSKGVIQ